TSRSQLCKALEPLCAGITTIVGRGTLSKVKLGTICKAPEWIVFVESETVYKSNGIWASISPPRSGIITLLNTSHGPAKSIRVTSWLIAKATGILSWAGGLNCLIDPFGVSLVDFEPGSAESSLPVLANPVKALVNAALLPRKCLLVIMV